MINSIGGNQGMLNTMMNQSVQRRPSPEEKFNEIDTDSSGGVSATELATLTEEISSRSGQTITTEDAFSTFDSDNDGALSQSEMDSMMTAVMEQFGPPSQSGGTDPSFQQALSSYSENMGSSELSSMIGQIGAMPAPPPPPNAAEQFSEVDDNDDGAISLKELIALTDEMSTVSGTSINADESLAASDADGDGVLNEEEMQSLMSELHEKLGPPPQSGNMSTMGDIFSSYLEDADSDTLSSLVEILGNHIASNAANYSTGVDVQA
ncbi:EF-hand domain-containing protein [Desulfogranum marinum]|uniref:EF-hand domain-containing protein n=1 Tax=Desulfogranum marinum TaxID=453220 RepID=UPI0029C704AA|nr:EF-hand domain-containing protein [Desulfogranum marinum]